MNECPICPLMSIGTADYALCVGERCQLWKFEKCGLINVEPDMYDVTESIDHLTEAMQTVAREIHVKPV